MAAVLRQIHLLQCWNRVMPWLPTNPMTPASRPNFAAWSLNLNTPSAVETCVLHSSSHSLKTSGVRRWASSEERAGKSGDELLMTASSMGLEGLSGSLCTVFKGIRALDGGGSGGNGKGLSANGAFPPNSLRQELVSKFP
eukprot:5556467-Amphidinium_carterae.1